MTSNYDKLLAKLTEATTATAAVARMRFIENPFL